MHPANADRMVAVLREFGFDSPELTAELFLKDKSIVRMGMPPMQIEIVTTISGVDFSECYNERNNEQLRRKRRGIKPVGAVRNPRRMTCRSNESPAGF